MNDSTSIVESQIPRNLDFVFNETTYLALNRDELFTKDENTIEILKKGDGVFRCVGTSVSNKWVLTAATCITFVEEPLDTIRCVLSRGDLEAYINKRITTPKNVSILIPNVQERTVESYILHPNFDKISGLNDMLLLKLSIAFTRNVIMKLETVPVTTEWTNCYAIAITIRSSSKNFTDFTVKLVQNVTIRPSSLKCKFSIKGNFICATYDIDSPCQGDPGVPLICNGKIIGIGTNTNTTHRHTEPRIITDNKCTVQKEFYFSPLHESIDWIRKNIVTAGYVSIYFNINWVLIALPLVSIP